jgi:hypothetical protein
MKPNPLVALYHFNGSQLFTLGSMGRRILRSFRLRGPRPLLLRGAVVYAQNLGHLRPLRPRVRDLADACDGDHRPDCPILHDLEAGGLTGQF